MPEEVESCVKPAAGPLNAEPPRQEGIPQKQEVHMAMARVGKEAPDFELPAYVAGQGFKNIKLSDSRGKWVVLCFYPGDFTFV
jgi:hypothetical protein